MALKAIKEKIKRLGYEVLYVPHKLIGSRVACYNVMYDGREIFPKSAVTLEIPLNQIWISERYKDKEEAILFHELQEMKYRSLGYSERKAHLLAKEDEKKFGIA